MKVKGANFFELHIEKIVLAVVAVVFVVVLVLQLGSDGPAVTVSGKPLPLEQAYEPAENLARQARTRISTENPELPELGEQVNLLASFRDARTADLAPVDRIALGPDITLAVGEVKGFENEPLADLNIPAPRNPAAHAFAGTLDPWVVEQTEGLADLVPPSQPYDAVAVSVQATFDSAAFLETMSADPPEGKSAWPMSWWRGSMDILAVRLERQRQNSDGSWGEEIDRVPTPPGRLDLPAELAEMEDLTPGQLKRTVEDVQRNLVPQVRRPDFYPIIAGEPWMEPREGARLVSLEAGENPEVAGLQRQLARNDERIERVVADLAALGASPDPDARGRPAPGGQQQQQDRARDSQIRRLRANYERLQAERNRLVEELTNLGFAPEGAEEEARQAQQQRQQGRPRGAREASPDSLVSGLPIEVWSHDVTAEPGQTYRYRVTLEFNNPAYGQEQFLIEDQQHLAEPVTVLSKPSPWTAPVTASPTSAFFVTGGNEAQQGATGVRMASANVDVFTFFYGYYRKGSLTLEPGEPAAAWAQLPENLPIFDTEQPPPQGGASMPAPIQERRQQQQQRGAAPVAGEQLGTRTLAEADAYLLDVYESAAREVGGMAAGRPPRIVAFGDSTGKMMRRLIEVDRRSPLYARLNASAEAGRTQGQPEPEAEAEQPDPRRGREPPPPPPEPMGPGGGGG